MNLKWIGYSDISSLMLENVLKNNGYTINWVKTKQEIIGEIRSCDNAIVFLNKHNDHDTYQLSRELLKVNPLLSIILVLPKQEIDLQKVLSSGATNILGIPLVDREVEQVIKEAESLARLKMNSTSDDKDELTTHIATISSTKGGVGKSTLTVNLAASIAKSRKRIALIDMDLQFGDIAIMFDIKPKKTIYEWVMERRIDPTAPIEEYIHRHSSGVDILAAPLRPEFADVITSTHIRTLIEELRPKYDVILIDTSPSIVETGLVALEESEDILIVTTNDLPTLKNIKLFIETLESLKMGSKIKVIINRETSIDAMKPDAIEKNLGYRIFSRIPSEEAVVTTSANNGIPFVITEPRSRVSRTVYSIANSLFQLEKSKKQQSKVKKPIFVRLFAK